MTRFLEGWTAYNHRRARTLHTTDLMVFSCLWQILKTSEAHQYSAGRNWNGAIRPTHIGN